MSPQIIIPKDKQHWLELRTEDITSTESPAMFGLSPYITPYELWFRKKDKVVVTIEENERMFWGTILQDAIAIGIAKQQKWTIHRMDDYYRIPELRLGTSLDFGIIDEEGMSRGLEIKNVDSLQFIKEWTINDDKSIEAPYHIETQVQQQLLVMGWDEIYIGVLIGGNRLELIKRVPDPKVHEAIKSNAERFWHSIDNNLPPKPDFNADADFISKLCNYAEPGKVIDVSNDPIITELALEQIKIKEQIRSLDKRCDSIRAEVLMRIGDAEKAISDKFKISAGVTPETWIEAYPRQAYRRFLINPVKEK